jgi:hypothetical protein
LLQLPSIASALAPAPAMQRLPIRAAGYWANLVDLIHAQP